MRKILDKYITSLDILDRSFLSGATSSVPLLSFATVLFASIAIGKANINLLLLVGNGIFKLYLKKIERKRNKHIKMVLLAGNKFSSIERILPDALIDTEINQ